MAQNPTVTRLDTAQAIKRTYDESNDAIRTIPADVTSFAIELDAADGDNVATKGLSSSTTANITNANTGVIIAAADCSGYKSFNLYTKTTTNIVGAQVCTVEVSPSDTDNVWKATSLTITPDATAGNVVMGTANSAIVARRIRVSIAASITSGVFDIYLVAAGI